MQDTSRTLLHHGAGIGVDLHADRDLNNPGLLPQHWFLHPHRALNARALGLDLECFQSCQPTFEAFVYRRVSGSGRSHRYSMAISATGIPQSPGREGDAKHRDRNKDRQIGPDAHRPIFG